jgi:hypothetical protein
MTINPEVYREAAELFVRRESSLHSKGLECCCGAIDGVTWDESYRDEFKKVFAPRKRANSFWWANPFRTDKDQLARSIALLLMAEILEGEKE